MVAKPTFDFCRSLSKSPESSRSSLIQKLRKEIAFILLAGDLSAFTCELFPRALPVQKFAGAGTTARAPLSSLAVCGDYPRVSSASLLISVDTVKRTARCSLNY